MTKRLLTGLLFLLPWYTLCIMAQKVEPTAYYTNEKGESKASTNITDGQAPLEVTFKANPKDVGTHTLSYEWHFKLAPFSRTGATEEAKEFLVRYEEDTQFTFTESGTYTITLKVTLEDGSEVPSTTVISIVISDSVLDYPNAFSPNDDGVNDTFGPKEGWRNIVSFHGYIFNRYGQKIFEWTNPADEWKGKFNGTDVKEGVYFLLVKAKGADGRVFNIRKDVNLIRGHAGEKGGGTTTTP